MEISKDKRYTYADYIAWGDDQRYELIDGVAYAMSAPGSAHKKTSLETKKRSL